MEDHEKIVEFFGPTKPALPGPESEEGIWPQVLTEEVLAEYHTLCEKLSGMEKVREEMRAGILKLMGEEKEAMRGKFACFVQARERSTVDWKKYILDQMGKDGIADAGRLDGPYCRVTESRALEVRKLGK